ncbi:MAG: hypothetical protein EAX87_10180 [Candidatus Thorarchaeota archaeon]|nr:hypothetical protein [Candidatus Thorarchaeota archaeon]
MNATTLSDLSRIADQRFTAIRREERRAREYCDNSIELRRYLAAEIANRIFEQRKDKALIENHRAGFIR